MLTESRTKQPRNIIKAGHVSGMEIKDWLWYHSHSSTKYTELARASGRYFNLLDDVQYDVGIDGHNTISVKPARMIA